MREAEMKLGAPPGFRLPELSTLPAGVTGVPAGTQQLTSTYFDTSDLRLARWGCSLRVRSGEGWTAKLPDGLEGHLLVRREHRFPGSPRKPPSAAVDLLRAYVRTSALEPVARLRTRRVRVELRTQDGPVAEVLNDEVSVLDGRRVAARFQEVEVEVRSTAPDGLLDAVRDRLRAAGAGAPDPTPKVRRALGARADGPVEVMAEEPGAGSPIHEVIRAALAASLIRLIQHDPGVRLGNDPEDVHQCRVAARRLRSDLRTFAPRLDAAWTSGLRDELRWLGRELGAVRDPDVMLEGFRSKVAALPEADRAAAAGLMETLHGERAEAFDRLTAAMSDRRYSVLLDRLVAAATEPVLLARADAPAVEELPPLATKPWAKVKKAVASLGADPTAEELHRVRIKVKRARYAAEAVAAVAGKDVAPFAKAAGKVQDLLGAHQDAVVAAAWLRERAGPGSRRAFVAGALSAMAGRDAKEAREAFPKAWRRLVKKEPGGWA